MKIRDYKREMSETFILFRWKKIKIKIKKNKILFFLLDWMEKVKSIKDKQQI